MYICICDSIWFLAGLAGLAGLACRRRRGLRLQREKRVQRGMLVMVKKTMYGLDTPDTPSGRPWKSSPLSGGATKNYALELHRKPLAVFVGHKLPEAPKKALRIHRLFLCPPAKPGLVRLTTQPRLPHPAGHALNGLMHQNKYHHKLPLPPDESLPFRRVRMPLTTTPQRSKFNRRPIVNLHIL